MTSCSATSWSFMEHFAFPGNKDFAADDQRIFMYCSWRADVFIHPSVFTISESRAISHANDTEQQIFHRNSSGERRLKFIARGEDSKKPRSFKAQRRQRRQNSDHKHVQRQRQNTTITLQMKPIKRGNTDCRRFKKPWGDQAMLAVYSKIIFLDATIGSNSYTICTMHSSFCDTRTSSLWRTERYIRGKQAWFWQLKPYLNSFRPFEEHIRGT